MTRPPFLAYPLAIVVACTATGCAGAGLAKSTTGDVPILPLKSVRLYEAGVGYFEREGTTGGRTSLPVPPGHLDDALKTLVVISKGGKAEVTGVAFPSSVTKGMARALAGLPANEEGPLSFRSLLNTMRGAHVVVRTKSGTETKGRLVDVVDGPAPPHEKHSGKDEKKDDKEGDTRPLVAIVLADSGEVMSFAEELIAGVRPTDPAFFARLGTALDAVSTQGTRNPRLVEVLGSAKEPVTLGYLAETPIWRTTYRVVLGDDDRAFLQGWALLHNDTDEHWQGVRVELVNGQPDSFLFPIAAPRYARRELRTPDNVASTVPQLLDNSADRMWGDHAEDSFGAGGLGLSGVGEGGGGRGEGVGLGSVSSFGRGSGTGSGQGYGSGSGTLGGAGASSLLDVGNLAKIAQADAIEGGALFRYVLPRGLDLGPRSSALVPFVSTPLTPTRITYVDGASARAGVRFLNQSKQTLPPGVVAFFADGGFAGETALPRLRPGEGQFVTFADDLDVEVTMKNTKTSDATQRVVFHGSTLEEHYLRATTSDYVVKNDAGRPRHIAIVVRMSNNGRIEGADRVEYDEARHVPLAVVDMPPKKAVSRAIATREGLVRRHALDSLDASHLEKLAREAAISAFEKQVLTEAAGKAKPVEAAKAAEKRAKEDLTKAEGDLAKLRENLKTLTTEKDKTHPFVVRVVAAEDSVGKLRTAYETLAKERVRLEGELTKTLEKMSKN